ncbi:MAG: SusD/RagB family nutrient-binding outer membrane lipoprotein [Bacteroidetes bacterium]|nr:SusD/RagB family nutrient-binding outer membrane lipoprotein [Bacteroidota bacterium]MBS1932755.1 SusD/RagB family nutrient-binding outer membrane lipoprotein [Bacteroidota bacterium]
MKILKQSFLIASILILLLSGCTKDLTKLNNDPKNPTTISYNALFTRGQQQLANLLNTDDYDFNPVNFFEQYWQETTYLNESQYDLNYRGIPDADWNILYLNVLENLVQADSLAKLQITDAGQLANVHAQIDITEVTAFYYLLTTYGNVPYTGAFNVVNNAFPKYDDAMTVYKDLLTRLSADISALNDASPGIGSADQLSYSGDIDHWKRYANSIALRMGLVIADVDDALAKSTIEAAAPNVLASNDDNANYIYLSSPPYVNPTYNFSILGARFLDFIACSTFITQLQSNNDPRLPLYFVTAASTGTYVGANPGDAGSLSDHATPAAITFTPDFRGVFLDYAETQFYLAEAAERGYSVGGTAAAFYKNGVEASIMEWGGSQSDADTYYNQPSVTYATAAGTWQQKIGTQAWIALYNRAWDGWVESRRLGFPVFPLPDGAVISSFPQRFKYPVTETNVNSTNYQAAAAAIGGDDMTTKLFFIKQ